MHVEEDLIPQEVKLELQCGYGRQDSPWSRGRGMASSGLGDGGK